MPNFKTIIATVTDKQTIAKDTFLVRMVSADMPVFDFLGGQFATITVAPNVKRSYSIASAPGKAFLDFIADNRRGGPGSQFFTGVVVGQQVEMIVPLGNFFYVEGPKPVYFFATGTGQVPFMSMIEAALTQQHSTRLMTLYTGFRYIEDVFAKEFFELMDVQYENFIYKLNLTQPLPDWEGPTGRITQYIDTLPDTDVECYICGSNEMVTDITARLQAKGVPVAQIHHEMFY